MARDAITVPGKTKDEGRLLLYLGLVLGIVAAVVVAMVLTNASDKGETPVPSTRFAVVAAQDIPARTRLSAEHLKVGVYKLEDVSSEAFTGVGQLTNRVTASEIKAGQVVLPAMVSDQKGTGLEFSVQPGMRAISIAVKEVVTAGGNVAPGNFVDVIGLFEVPKEGDPNAVALALLGEGFPRIIVPAGVKTMLSLTLLQNVRVLAVAQNLPTEQSNTAANTGTSASKETGNPKAATVTLEVTPQQAQILALADSSATLRLTLRPFAEDTRNPVPPFIIGIVD